MPIKRLFRAGCFVTSGQFATATVLKNYLSGIGTQSFQILNVYWISFTGCTTMLHIFMHLLLAAYFSST